MADSTRCFDRQTDPDFQVPGGVLAICLLSAFGVSNAYGQAAPTAPGGSTAAAGLEEIIVTAEKRTASAQTVPIAITAVTGADLDAAGVESTFDLQFAVPDLVISTNTAFAQAYIRGVGTDIASIGSDPSVAVIIDGVYVARPSAAFQQFYDIARVEVLNGPQGTLYGRNATGGVVNIVSEAPTDEFSGKADVMVGNYGQTRLRASLSGPLIDDRLSGRLSILSGNRNGFTKNLVDGSHLDDEDLWATKGALAVTPSDTVKIVLAGDYSKESDSRGTALKVLSADAPALLFGGTVPADPFEVLFDFRPHFNAENYGASGTVTWDLPRYTLTSITAYRHSQWDLTLDLDGTQVSFINHDPDEERSDMYSEELRLASTGEGRLDWMVGAYALREDATAFYNLVLPLFSLTIRPDAEARTDAYALFGQGTYHFDDRLALTLGLRYSKEEKRQFLESLTNGAITGTSKDKATFDAFTPRISLNYTPDAHTLVYVSATRGFKSGGFNSTAIQVPQSFEPEYVWSYEAGLKATWLDRRLRSNFAAFYYDYTDLQVNRFDANLVTLENAAKATIAGVEADLVALPVQGLELSLGLAYLDATYDKFITDDPDQPQLGPIDLAGNRLVRAPELSVNAAIQYGHQLGRDGTLTGRIAYEHRGEYFFTPYNAPDVAENGYGLVNARVDYRSANDHWQAGIFVQNLGDVVYYQNMLRSAGLVGTLGFLGAPRTYGAQLAYAF